MNTLKNAYQLMLNDQGSVSEKGLLGRTEYEGVRSDLLAYGRNIKEKLRIGLGDSFSLLFETRATAWLQIHEELRWIASPDPSQVLDILERYNQLVPQPQSVCACLFLDTRDPANARRILRTTSVQSLDLGLSLNGSIFKALSLENNHGCLEPVTYFRFTKKGPQDLTRPNLIHWSQSEPHHLAMPDYMADALTSVLDGVAMEAVKAEQERPALVSVPCFA